VSAVSEPKSANDDARPAPAAARSLSYLLHRQPAHWLALATLMGSAWWLAQPSLGDGSWLGISDQTWFWLCVGLAAAHQLYVWLLWRLQLGWQLLTRALGDRDFQVFGAGFLPQLIARPLLLIALALADRGSLGLPRMLELAAASLLFAPAAWGMFSTLRYFGIPRALGGDHFRERYRRLPMVRRGAFRYVPNTMYTIVFLALPAIALLASSRAALIAGVFQHAAIWAHYWCTEKPDMKLLYEG